jgi:PAS domain S-box-containing protein
MTQDMPHAFNTDNENIFFRCVQDSSEAIMISDKDGVLVYVNPAWTRIYGYTREEAIGKTPRLLHSGHQSDEFYREMWASIRNPAAGGWKGELVNKAKDGTLVPVLLTITPYRNQENAQISGYMGIAVDLTYKRELEAKVAHQDRLASIGLLASGLAHEIGTPMGVIRGRAEFLMMKTEESSLKKNLGVIVSEIDRISKIIRSLLRVSRSFSDVHLENVKPHDVLGNVLALVGQNLREDHIELLVEIPPELQIRADSSRLEQILLNLVMNSNYAIRKAKKEGRTEGHFLRFSSQSRGNGQVVLSVEDSGCGISPENMKKLFKPFFTTKDVGEGTGLGLAIISQLVREMEGEVSVQSTVGKGTTFSVTLRSTQ